jgi:plastocyanin
MTSPGIRAAAVAASLLWCMTVPAVPAPEATPGVTQVLIQDFMFMPMQLRIKAGSSVTWVNQDDEPHTVVGEAGLFRSGALDTAMAFTFRFEKPGTYQVFCSIHPQMKATVIVE